MANQPKSYRKFLAGSVTAALVASAVAPAASAAENNFPDVPADDVHADNIAKAVEMGLINGYDDGTFGPYQDISRGQVAKIIARYLGDVDTTNVEQFTDVAKSGDTELHEAALTVKAANVFTGRNGELDFEENITREEMASVIVRVFDHLVDLEDVEPSVTDVEAAFPVHQDNIKLLSEWGITDVDVFNPKGDLQRAQFVSFMIRAIESMDMVVEEPAVESVSAITTTDVTVTLEASDEAREDFTIEVVNPSGDVVEVNPVLVDAGETEATFTFVEELEEVELGIWTVGGAEFDTAAVAAVLAVNDASDQVELLEALNSSYFENVDADKIVAYWNAFTGLTDEPVSVEDVQDVIDTVNMDATELAAVEAITDALDNNNQVELLAALDSNYFTRVNADFIADYFGALNVATLTNAESVQAVIDTVNYDNAVSAVDAAELALTTSSYNEALALVNSLPADEEGSTLKADELDRLDLVSAFISLDNATTKASVLKALKAEAFDLTDINDTLSSYYKTLVDGLTLTIATNLQTAVVDQGNTNATNDILADVAAVDADTTEASVVTLLQSSVLDLDDVNADYAAEYKAAIIDDIANNASAGIASAATIQTAIVDAVNVAEDEEARVAAANAATTAVELRTALTQIALDDAVTNVNYINLTSTGKLEVAELVLEARADLVDEEFATEAAIEAEIATQISARSGLITDVNAVSDIATTDAALDALGYTPYEDLTAAEQLRVAEEFLAAFPVDEDGVRVDYTTLTAIKSAVDSAINAAN
jgi:hypothetical protein